MKNLSSNPAPGRSGQAADAVLLARFRDEGDTAAFAMLFERHAIRIRRIAERFAVEAADVDDIVQNCFLRVIVGPTDVGAAESVEAWLCDIATREGEALQKDSAGRQREIPDVDRVDDNVDVRDDVLQQTEEARILARAIAGLPEPYRSVLHLRFHEATSTTSIAQELHRPRETVRKQLSRGIELLRRALPPSLFGALGLLGFGRGSPAMPLPELTRPRYPLAKLALRPRILVGISAVGLSVLVGLLWWQSDDVSRHEGPVVLDRQEHGPESPTAKSIAKEESSRSSQEVRIEGPAESPTKTEPAAFQLRVVDTVGRAVPDVQIIVMPVDERPFLALSHAALTNAAALVPGEGTAGETAIIARSDARGELVVPGLVDGRYGVFAPGFLPGSTFFMRGGRGSATLTLPQDVKLRGRVVDRTGGAVASAAIFVSGTGGELDFGTQVAESGTDGTFEVRSFMPTSSFWARSPDGAHSQLVSAHGAATSVVELRIENDMRDLEVRVRSRGDRPVPHALVAWMPNDRRRQAAPLLVPRHARTDAAGRVILAKLARRDALVLAYADGLASQATLVRKDDRTCILVLHPGLELTGTVRDADGNPAVAARVSAQPVSLTPGYSTGGLMTRSTSADSHGRYRLSNLPATSVAALALTRPQGGRQARGRAVCDLERESNLDLIVREDPVLIGTLRPSDAATHRQWRLTAIPREGASRGMRQRWTSNVLSKADGRFEFTVLLAGVHLVGAFASTDAIWPSVVFEAKAGQPVDIVAPSPETSRVVGRIVVPAGIDVRSCRPRLQRVDWPSERGLDVDEGGGWIAQDLPRGQYLLRLDHAALGRFESAPFEVFGNGEEHQPELRVPVGHRLRVVIDREVQADASVHALLLGSDGDAVARASATSGAGGIVFDKVAAGDYMLQVWSTEVLVRRQQVKVGDIDLEVAVTNERSAPCNVEVSVTPSSGKLAAPQALEIEVRDRSGATVFEDRCIAELERSSKSSFGLRPGLYGVRATVADGRWTAKVIEVTEQGGGNLHLRID